MLETKKQLKFLSRAYLDIQKFRCENFNRLNSSAKILDDMEYSTPKDYPSWIDFYSIKVHSLVDIEKELQKQMEKILKKEPLWIDYLKDVKGVGPVIAASVIGEIGSVVNEDTKKTEARAFDKTCKLWAYAGLAVDKGEAVKRKKGEKSNWNRFLKLSLWKFSESIIKQKNSKYRDLYDERKPIEEKKHDWKTCKSCQRINEISLKKTKKEKDCSKLHIHNRTMRYVQKKFLSDIYHYWLGNKNHQNLV